MKEIKKTLFITNAGSKKHLGFGHLFRCINIANLLKNKHKIYFKTNTKISKKIIRNYKFILESNSFIKYDYILIDLPNSNRVNVDKYKNSKIIVIDEFNNFKNKNNFTVYKPTDFKKFYFLKFSFILKKPYKTKKIKKRHLDYLISFGGSDYYGYSEKIFKYLLKNNISHFKFLKKFNGDLKIPKKNIIKNTDTIFSRYKIKCFIGSGGNTMFEMLYNKIPCLIIPTNNIEKKYVLSLKKKFQVNFFKFNKKISEQKIRIMKKKHIKLDKKYIAKCYNNLFKF